MRDLRELLQGSFESHADALGTAGASWDGLAERSVRDARTRRAWRASAVSTVAAAAVVGIVATAVAVTGGGSDLSPAQRLVMDDPNSLGACTAYMPANAEVFPDGWYVGRAYIDSASDFVVAVTPDGTVTRVQPDENGDYYFDFGKGSPKRLWSSDRPDGMAPLIDDEVVGAGGGGIWVDAGLDSYAWTRVEPAPTPDGVNVNNLWRTLAITLTGGGQGYDPSAVPRDARTDFVAGYSDGHEDTGKMAEGAPTPSLKEDINTDGLAYMALRVTLADGETWDLRFDYTPENIPELPCQPTPPSGWEGWTTPSPSEALAPAVSTGPAPSAGTTEEQAMSEPLSGPESAVFQCGAPLPADLQDSGDVAARLASGVVTLDEPDVFDVGDEGVVIEASFPLWEVDMASLDDAPRIAGWLTTGQGAVDGPFYGNVGLTEVVALLDGVIVAAAGDPVEDWTAGGVGGNMTAYRNTGDPLAGGFISAFNGIHGLLQPCGDATSADLADAQLAVLYGFGPDAGNMSYGWTLVTD